MNHITEDQIEWIYTRYDGDMINCANAVARQAVVSYIDQQAKELPVLPQGYGSIPWAYRGNVFIESQLKAYGAACAAHAREMALSEAARVAAEECDVVEAKGNTHYAQLGDAAATQRGIVAAIEALKGK